MYYASFTIDHRSPDSSGNGKVPISKTNPCTGEAAAVPIPQTSTNHDLLDLLKALEQDAKKFTIELGSDVARDLAQVRLCLNSLRESLFETVGTIEADLEKMHEEVYLVVGTDKWNQPHWFDSSSEELLMFSKLAKKNGHRPGLIFYESYEPKSTILFHEGASIPEAAYGYPFNLED